MARQARNGERTIVEIGVDDLEDAREAVALCPKPALALKAAK
ncbi:hypothetical protein [Specibacter sp. NPDC078692]